MSFQFQINADLEMGGGYFTFLCLNSSHKFFPSLWPLPPPCCLSASVVQTPSITDVSVVKPSVYRQIYPIIIYRRCTHTHSGTLSVLTCLWKPNHFCGRLMYKPLQMCITVGQEWFPRVIKQQFALTENLTLPPCYLKPPAERTLKWTYQGLDSRQNAQTKQTG